MTEKIIKLICQACAIEESVGVNTEIKTLSIDSLSFIELLVCIEEEFDIEFEFNELDKYNWIFVEDIIKNDDGYKIITKDNCFESKYCIVSVGRSGSSWMEGLCKKLNINTKSNRVDIGIRFELPAEIFSHLTDELYESKIVYRTEKFEDAVRTFCMNPNGIVVNENTNGIVTVNGHSYEDPKMKTKNTNFALLVAKHFSEPFKDIN